MQITKAQTIIRESISTVAEMSSQSTDGLWLEELTVLAGPHIREWDTVRCHSWAEWPEREQHFPRTSHQDIGIDVVAIRRSDGRHIAIQCKSRQLDQNGRGRHISKGEIDKFASTSSNEFWVERWIVTNGDSPISGNTEQALSMLDKPVKMINVAYDLWQQQAAFTEEECPHCKPNPDGEERRQSKTCMQSEAVAESVRILRQHEASDSGGLPVGQARGRIILPCGTGKTRISLRIVEELTSPGELSIVLCPSIALVAQIRREYLQHAEMDMRALAVCSDETAGYDPRKKEKAPNTLANPTVDNSHVSASEVKGSVTTNPMEIARWIQAGQGTSQVSVLFGTYQSGRRVADALHQSSVTIRVLVADEAHRTAGLRRKRKPNASTGPLSEEERRIRDFTLCHDNKAFPTAYRIYQTATPRIYDTRRVNRDQPSEWIVRTMDDETVFGVELYRKSYVEAVKNGWLSDYGIIALGVNDPEAFRQANLLAASTRSKGRRALTSSDYLRGLAFVLAMGGATQDEERGLVPITSCIAFMNTVDKSKNMAEDLQTDTVRTWLQHWLHDNREGQKAAQYTLEHLDATSNVTARDNAKRRLAESNTSNPHGIINVGIFGEGTDSPSLNAVAFLEARKSPIDVIQAVGRAMRTVPGKKKGYIICPILIPPNVDPEQWLSVSDMEEGWQELGQILLALRAHDQRIEDNLADLLQLYLPKPPEVQRTLIAIAYDEDRRIQYREHEGPPGEAQAAVERVLEGQSTLASEFRPIAVPQPTTPARESQNAGEAVQPASQTVEPTQIVTGKRNNDSSLELRMDTIARAKPKSDGTRGEVDIRKSKAKARDMINQGQGIRLGPQGDKKHRTRKEVAEQSAMQMLLLSGMEEHGNAIRMNLLSKSGLTGNRVARDLNLLESSVKEAAHHMRADSLQPVLDHHFGLDNLNPKSRSDQADGCTIAALLLMNAAMLHQRISNGGWLPGVTNLSHIKNATNVIIMTQRQWNAIMRHDFRPVLEPAIQIIEAIEDTGRLAGLERAIRHLTTEAERIAETYADMGADHAGPLFNRVMGNQASDGAYFTRPVAASIAAHLTLDACGEMDWTNPGTWKSQKTVDLACGSGTLLAAMLTEMKRRAREQGASETQLTALQQLAVEDTIKGLDINSVSLQLAASQLTAGNQAIRYRRMGLHQMPYGPSQDTSTQVSAGTLELLGQKAIVQRRGELQLEDQRLATQAVWNQHEDAELESAVDAVKDARIVIMNPPFTNRTKMGEKFSKSIQRALRARVDAMEKILVRSDEALKDFVDKNSLEPLFTTIADKCLNRSSGVLTMINPTVALCAPSALEKRRILAKRYHIHTVLTCHQPGQINLSQSTNINESIIVAKRYHGPKPPTRFINLDRLPTDEFGAENLQNCLAQCSIGTISNGWGEVSEWPAERMEAGDWTPAIWRSPKLAAAAASLAGDSRMKTIKATGLSAQATGQLLRSSFKPSTAVTLGNFPILKSKGADGQTTIQSTPDEFWIPKVRDERIHALNGGIYPEVKQIMQKAGYLLITAGQRTNTARITAVASNEKYVGNGWMPVTGLSIQEAKAVAVYINSTAGRLQLMRTPGKTLDFPTYSVAEVENIKIPDIKDASIRQTLANCWDRTKDLEVPQFRDGECKVRCQWDKAVARAMGWDVQELTDLSKLLNNEPHIRGLGYNQYSDVEQKK